MSKVSTIYDALVSSLDTLFPAGESYQRIYNAYDLSDNPEHVLRKGYGLMFESSTLDVASNEFGAYEKVATITIPFTREVIRQRFQVENMDENVKAVMEDVHTITSNWSDPSNINENIEDVAPSSDSGVEFIRGEKQNFISVAVTFEIKFKQKYLNC